MFILVLSMAIGLSVGVVSYRIIKAHITDKKSQNSMSRVKLHFLMRLTHPITKRVAPYIKMPDTWVLYSKLQRQIVQSGLDDCVKVSDLIAFKIAMTLFGLIAGLLVFGSNNTLVLFAFTTFGYLYATIHFKSIVSQRIKKIEEELPYLFDMLSLSVEAGMDFVQAIVRIKDRMRCNPLKDELERMHQSIIDGARRTEALKLISQRLDVPSITSFVTLLVQADRLGTGIGGVLRAHSKRLRGERLIRAEEAGAKASQKMLFPLIFCIMPATFIVVFGPIVVRLITGEIAGLM